MNAKEMREDFKARLITLQMNCPHETSTWMGNAWAPGHIFGRVLVCDRCEKILDNFYLCNNCGCRGCSEAYFTTGYNEDGSTYPEIECQIYEGECKHLQSSEQKVRVNGAQ